MLSPIQLRYPDITDCTHIQKAKHININITEISAVENISKKYLQNLDISPEIHQMTPFETIWAEEASNCRQWQNMTETV